jgi:hypothetical protein
MKTETLRVTWKIIRRAGYGKTKKTYCKYIAENTNHKHELRAEENTELFKLLSSTVVSSNSERYSKLLFVDAEYYGNALVKIKNPRNM